MPNTLTDDEMISLGMNPIIGGEDGGEDFGEDNEAGDLLDLPMGQRVQYDSQGRPVITYGQMKQLRKRDVQVSAYALRVYRPLSNSKQTWLVPANLYQKWYGQEYAAPDDEVGIQELYRQHGRRPPATISATPPKERLGVAPRRPEDELEERNAPQVKVFFCNEKYPDCARFFDTEKGLSAHWKLQHGTKPIAASARKKLVGTVAPSSEEE